MLEEYFWQELSRYIGERYAIYEDAKSRNNESASQLQGIDVPVLKIDLDKMRKLDDFKGLVERHEAFLKTCFELFDKDASCFVDKVEEYDHLHSSGQSDQIDRNLRVSELFDSLLCPWFDARHDLAFERLNNELGGKNQLPEQLMLQAQLDVLHETNQIRRLYVLLELGLPTVFACSVLIYVWYAMPK
ncbi:MAG TPA: hypothetical protein VH988_05730 [Thermoanaerobaculia bacterium]|jgi:hypothetical protein|nr:hypothetical protein [Thermoanaerobaculia bacterium]